MEEDGSALVLRWLREATAAATSAIAYVEARAAMARRRQLSHVLGADYRRIVRDFDADWERYIRLDVTEGLLRDAAGLAESHKLRVYDAVHLASALAFRNRQGGGVSLASWDHELAAAARREGFDVLPGRRG